MVFVCNAILKVTEAIYYEKEFIFLSYIYFNVLKMSLICVID